MATIDLYDDVKLTLDTSLIGGNLPHIDLSAHLKKVGRYLGLEVEYRKQGDIKITSAIARVIEAIRTVNHAQSDGGLILCLHELRREAYGLINRIQEVEPDLAHHRRA